MEQEKECYFCSRKESETELFDAIDGTELTKVCGDCLRRENLPLVQKPDYAQLAESEKSYTVYQRLSRMAGMPQKIEKKKPEEYIPRTGITLDKLRKPIDYNTRTLRKEGYEIVEKPIAVVDNFHWFIQTTRRRMTLSQKQLADAIGEREEKISLIEEGNFPEGAEKIITKLEQFLKIKLIKGSPQVIQTIRVKPTPVIKEDWSYSEAKEEPAFVREKPEKKSPSSYILKVDREKMKNLTIADLQKMKREKEKIEKEVSEFSNENEMEEEGKYKQKIERKSEREMNMKEIDAMIWRRSKDKPKKKDKPEEVVEEGEEAKELLEEADAEEEKKEKKPGFFSRIFKRKKKVEKLSQEEIDDIVKKQNKDEQFEEIEEDEIEQED
jgi:ribosome-binding protein aMBF1 (putative translation factor)